MTATKNDNHIAYCKLPINEQCDLIYGTILHLCEQPRFTNHNNNDWTIENIPHIILGFLEWYEGEIVPRAPASFPISETIQSTLMIYGLELFKQYPENRERVARAISDLTMTIYPPSQQ